MRQLLSLLLLISGLILVGCNNSDSDDPSVMPDGGSDSDSDSDSDADTTPNLTHTCDVDTTKTGYDLAAAYDDCQVWNAQKIMAHIESEDIDIRAHELTEANLGAAKATLNAEENWIEVQYTFLPEDMTAYPDSPDSINGIIMAKMKTKESIDTAFGFSNGLEQGLCSDAQQRVYDTVLSSILTEEQRAKYESSEKQLAVLPDGEPEIIGGQWYGADPGKQITNEGDTYYYQPKSLLVVSDDPNLPDDVEEGLVGVVYCKFLTHQAVLSWMLTKSFEDNPVLIAQKTTSGCDQPSSFESRAGSCFFYFSMAQAYYCSDYTGTTFDDVEAAKAKCDRRTSSDLLETTYSDKPCSERTDELEANIPGYIGFNGACVVHCKEEGEFIWNIYEEDPASKCEGYDLITKEETEAILGSQ